MKKWMRPIKWAGKPLVQLMFSTTLMLSLATESMGALHFVSAHQEVEADTYRLTIPPVTNGSELAVISVTVSAAPGWTVVRRTPNPPWEGTWVFQYDGTRPGQAYRTTFKGRVVLEDPEPPKGGGGGGGGANDNFFVNADGEYIEPEYYILPPKHTVYVGQEATFTAYKRPRTPEVSNWTLDGDPRPDADETKSFEADAPGTYTVGAEANGLSDTARVTFFKAVLVVPEKAVADNFPVNEISLSVDPEYALDEVTIASISNTPTDPDPRNALGTTDMVFTETGRGKWKIEKAIWYGSTANPVAYGRWTDRQRGTEYRAPHDITVTLILSNGHECRITGVLLVELTDGNPSVSPEIEWNSEIKYSIQLGYYIDMTDVLFYKSHVPNNFDQAVSQYRDMILKEENAHINQWYGRDITGIGWRNPSDHHHGDVLTPPAWEQLYIDSAVAEGGAYDNVNRRITFKPRKAEGIVNMIEQNARAKVLIEQWPTLREKRRPLMEKEAKSFAGFREAYGYEHTYMLPPDNFPENPELVVWP